jgi:hypothetical protein
MSAPANKAALDKLEKAAEENMKAGDWVYTTLPNSVVPIPTDRELSSEDILKLVGGTPLRPKQ